MLPESVVLICLLVPCSGAYSDFQNATDIATHMVTSYGMSEKAGIRVIDRRSSRPADATEELIDAEIKRLLQVPSSLCPIRFRPRCRNGRPQGVLASRRREF